MASSAMLFDQRPWLKSRQDQPEHSIRLLRLHATKEELSAKATMVDATIQAACIVAAILSKCAKIE
jgi:hypothetical protein